MPVISASPVEKLYYVLELLEHKAAITPNGGQIHIFLDFLTDDCPLQSGEMRVILEKLEKDEQILSVQYYAGQMLPPRVRATNYCVTLKNSFTEYMAKFKNDHLSEIAHSRTQRGTQKQPEDIPTTQGISETKILAPDLSSSNLGTKKIWLRFDGMTRQITLNDCFLVSQPVYDSENYRFIDYVWDNPNRTIELTELNQKLEVPLKKPLAKIIENLNFRGALKDAFFKVSKTSVCFTPTRTVKELQIAGLYPLRLFSSQSAD